MTINIIEPILGTGKPNINNNTFSKIFDLFRLPTKEGGINASGWIYTDTNEQVTTLHHINLGIRQIIKPDYSISKNISYFKLNINGYEYRYDYGEIENEKYKYYQTPTVKWQSITDKETYTKEIYPSDAYYASIGGNIKAQIIYRIDITNNTLTDIDGVYKEHKLVIDANKLKIEWDNARYILDNQNNENKWDNIQNNDYGSATYNEKIEIEKGKTKTLFVTYNLKNEILSDLINNADGTIEKVDYPTKVTAEAYHIYTRYDYSWEYPANDVEGENVSQNAVNPLGYWSMDNKNQQNEVVDGKEGKLHKSISKIKSDEAPFLGITMGDKDRTISGNVFKDNNERQSSHEVVGNGKYENDENVISNVKVDIINADGTYAMLYSRDEDKKEYYTSSPNIEGKRVKEIKSDQNGLYEIKGIIPGEYNIVFTYGNGEQKTLDSTENEISIYSNGYKSTIVNDDRIKLAYNNRAVNGNDISNDRTKYRWYLYLDKDKKFNTAVDEINNDSFGYEQAIDYRILNKENQSSKLSKTPLISVPIELTNDEQAKVIDSPNYNYANMSFGIIEKPEIKMVINKEITNVKITLQNGQVLINGNPTEKMAYISNLDTVWNAKGSKNVKIELDNQYLYGSTLEIRYTLTLQNNSEITYLTEDYYKYGKINEDDEEAKIQINSLTEYVDPELSLKLYKDVKEGSGDLEYTYNDRNENKKIEVDDLPDSDVSDSNGYAYKIALTALETKEFNKRTADNFYYKTLYQIGKDDYNYKINSKKLSSSQGKEANDSSTELIAVAKTIISDNDNDMEYIDYSQISKITTALNAYSDPTAAPLVIINNQEVEAYSFIPTDSAKIRATPSTGFDRSLKYYISIIIILGTVGMLIVCLKIIKKN